MGPLVYFPLFVDLVRGIYPKIEGLFRLSSRGSLPEIILYLQTLFLAGDIMVYCGESSAFCPCTMLP